MVRFDIEQYAQMAAEHAAITILWQAPDATEDGNGFPIGEGGNEYSNRVYSEVFQLTKMVRQFVKANYNLLMHAGVSAEQCGHDIILTANHHGTGFWDRGLGDIGERLSVEAQNMWGYEPFDAEFALNEDGDVDWLMVMNYVLVDEREWSV